MCSFFLLNFCREIIYHYSNLAQLCIFFYSLIFFITEYLLCIFLCLCVQENHKKRFKLQVTISYSNLAQYYICFFSFIFFHHWIFICIFFCIFTNVLVEIIKQRFKLQVTITQILLNIVYFSFHSFFPRHYMHTFCIWPKKNICVFTVTCQKNLGSVGRINFFFFIYYRQNRK